MDASNLRGPMPSIQKWNHMSYMYGPHMKKQPIYFGGDDRVVIQDTPKPIESPPAWLVADWMLAKHRGEPLTPFATGVLQNTSQWNQGLRWLQTYLDQYEHT